MGNVKFNPDKKVWDKLPKTYTKTLLKSIRELASKGINQIQISRKLLIHKNAFNKHKEVYDAFMGGRDDMALATCEKILESDDYRHHNLVAQKMNLFAVELEIPEIKDIPSLIAVQGLMLREFASGNLSPETMNTFAKSASLLGQSYFDANVQAQLDELKVQIKGLTHGTK